MARFQVRPWKAGWDDCCGKMNSCRPLESVTRAAARHVEARSRQSLVDLCGSSSWCLTERNSERQQEVRHSSAFNARVLLNDIIGHKLIDFSRVIKCGGGTSWAALATVCVCARARVVHALSRPPYQRLLPRF